MSDNFDEYVKDCKAKEKTINSLHCEISCLQERTDVLEKNLMIVSSSLAESRY